MRMPKVPSQSELSGQQQEIGWCTAYCCGQWFVVLERRVLNIGFAAKLLEQSWEWWALPDCLQWLCIFFVWKWSYELDNYSVDMDLVQVICIKILYTHTNTHKLDWIPINAGFACYSRMAVWQRVLFDSCNVQKQNLIPRATAYWFLFKGYINDMHTYIHTLIDWASCCKSLCSNSDCPNLSYYCVKGSFLEQLPALKSQC